MGLRVPSVVTSLVVLAGSGHIDRGFGIPARAAQRTGGRTATVHLAPGGDPARLFVDHATQRVQDGLERRTGRDQFENLAFPAE